MEEMIDVLDENGVKTGQVATRSEVHQKGMWHRVAAIVVIDTENRILLQQRSNDKQTNAGRWDIAAAGHVDAGEDSFTAILREVEEEVGVKVDDAWKAKDLRFVTCFRKDGRFQWQGKELYDRQYTDCYILRNVKIEVEKLRLQESEVQAAKLCTLEEFKQMITDDLLVHRKSFYDEVIAMMEKSLRG